MGKMTGLKQKIYWILLVFGIICILDFIFLLALHTVINAGIALPGLVGILLIVLSYLKLFKEITIFKNVYLARALFIGLILFVISFIAIEVLIWSSTQNEKYIKTDYVILLGAGLKGDKITATFMNRIENCVQYLQENPGTGVVVTGGQGYGESISEAEAMKRYLLGCGIREERILKKIKQPAHLRILNILKWF